MIYRCWYSKDVQRTKSPVLMIARLIHSLYTTKVARLRCYKMLSTIFKCYDVQHTISATEGCGRLRGWSTCAETQTTGNSHRCHKHFTVTAVSLAFPGLPRNAVEGFQRMTKKHSRPFSQIESVRGGMGVWVYL